jgi:hypothetical protein
MQRRKRSIQVAVRSTSDTRPGLRIAVVVGLSVTALLNSSRETKVKGTSRGVVTST